MLRITNLALALFLSLFIATSAQAASIFFDPNPVTANPGSTSVDILVSGLMAGEDVGGFEFTINFDDSLVSIDGFSFGSDLGMFDPDPLFSEIEDLDSGLASPGVFDLAMVSFADLSSQPDSFVLATLDLSLLVLGESSLGITGFLFDDLGMEIASVGFEDGQVSAVPLPGAVWLLLAGFGGILGLKKRR